MKMTTIGIDLAKNVFQIHGVDAHGNAVLRKKLLDHYSVSTQTMPKQRTT